jgi:predicted nuclease of predicted toxin-antitoxin system
MTFLLDHDTPDDLAYSLRALNHGVVYLRNVLSITAKDRDVIDYAHKHGYVLITCNRDDFLELAAAIPHCGIIILIRRKSRAAERAALVRLLDHISESGLSYNINFA